MSRLHSIEVNGRDRKVAAGTIRDLLAELGHDPQAQGVAVAINDEVIRRGQWANTAVESGDRVEIVGAVQGG